MGPRASSRCPPRVAQVLVLVVWSLVVTWSSGGNAKTGHLSIRALRSAERSRPARSKTGPMTPGRLVTLLPTRDRHRQAKTSYQKRPRENIGCTVVVWGRPVGAQVGAAGRRKVAWKGLRGRFRAFLSFSVVRSSDYHASDQRPCTEDVTNGERLRARG